MSNRLLFPNVAGTPGSPITREPAQAPDPGSAANLKSVPTESFEQIFGSTLERPITEPLKFSAHASARLQSRKLTLGPEQMRVLNEAVDRAAAKGLDDTLILTREAAYIVNVGNRTVVTAMDRNQLDGSVFTNIDGAVIV